VRVRHWLHSTNRSGLQSKMMLRNTVSSLTRHVSEIMDAWHGKRTYMHIWSLPGVLLWPTMYETVTCMLALLGVRIRVYGSRR
jgi:hypothetical protein